MSPRYPSILGRMKAKKTPIEVIETDIAPDNPTRQAQVTAGAAELGRDPGKGPDAARAVVDMLIKIGVVAK